MLLQGVDIQDVAQCHVSPLLHCGKIEQLSLVKHGLFLT